MRTALRTVTPPALRRLAKRLLAAGTTPNYARIWRAVCQQWMLGSAKIDDRSIEVTGWAVVPRRLRRHVGFTFNGRPFDEVEFPVPRPDVAASMPFVAGAEQSGFVCRGGFDPGRRPPVGSVTFACTDRRTGRDLGPLYLPWHLYHTPDDALIPDQQRRSRVIGRGLEFNFRCGGYTTFRRLGDALWEATGEGFPDLPRVLDWGCGCGRVGRYLAALDGVELTGADVDLDNVGWCREHLRPGRFETIPLRPPTGLADGAFDCVIGVSVLTHLREPDQFLWLEELRRITRPGGVLLLTFHGKGSLAWARPDAESLRKLRKAGIADVQNHIYDADLSEEAYYRDTYHTERYVRRNWGRYFRVLDVRHHYITHQDLAILRRE